MDNKEPVKIGEHEYMIGKIDAFKQLHVARRLAPAIAGMKDAILALDNGQGAMAAIEPFAQAVSKLEDKDVEYILNTCLDVVTRKQANGTGWARVRSNGGLMFQDIDMMVMLQLAWAVIGANLMPFFAGLPSILVDGETT